MNALPWILRFLFLSLGEIGLWHVGWSNVHSNGIIEFIFQGTTKEGQESLIYGCSCACNNTCLLACHSQYHFDIL